MLHDDAKLLKKLFLKLKNRKHSVESPVVPETKLDKVELPNKQIVEVGSWVYCGPNKQIMLVRRLWESK